MFQPAEPKVKGASTASPIPGAFPEESTLSETITGTETGRPSAPVTRPLPLLTYPPMGSDYEGPHVAFQPAQIWREVHALAPNPQANPGADSVTTESLAVASLAV